MRKNSIVSLEQFLSSSVAFLWVQDTIVDLSVYRVRLSRDRFRDSLDAHAHELLLAASRY